MDTAELKARVAERVEARAGALDELALRIHERPELAYEERFASSALADQLTREGASVTRGTGGLETAFSAEIGTGAPVVAILGEYDALPGVGHACGHNLMGTAASLAFLALRDIAPELRGRVRVVGCPAEERGNGKVKLIRAGVFSDVDVALMYHPGDTDEIDPLMLAMVTLDIEFIGKAAHAAAEPEEGRNALDAGAAAIFMVRSPDNRYLQDLRRRVLACFEGAATATGCELHATWSDVCEIVSTNRPLADAFAANAKDLGRQMKPRRPGDTHGSTDMGNVTSIVPGIHPFLSITDGPVPGHSVEFAAAARTPRALETMHVAAKALAMTAIDVLRDDKLRIRAREAFDGHQQRR